MWSSWCAAGRRVGASVLPRPARCRRAPERGRRNPGTDVRVASCMAPLSLSVLDLVPVRAGQRSADAVAATVALAQRADELGLTRYWLAEHHNMPSVASTNPPVLLGVLAGRTERIRLGSGGVMLPNHAPFVIAEQFAAARGGARPAASTSASAARRAATPSSPRCCARPGTRATSTRSRTTCRTSRPCSARTAPACSSRPASSTSSGRPRPRQGGPTLWLLGSSDYSAELAARLGLPVRLRPPLLRRGHRARARPVPVAVPAERAARRAPHLPHRQRRRGRDRGGGGAARPAAAAAHGSAAHRHAPDRARHGRGRPRGER